MATKPKKFAVIGCGFWAQYQIAAWSEIPEAELVAVCDMDLEKAERTAQKFGASRFYQQAKEMFEKEQLDFVDIITNVETHVVFVQMAADFKVPVICQKPLGPDLKTIHIMINYCMNAGVPLFVHENFRWQEPIRRLKQVVEEGTIGKIFKGRLTFCSAFPVFDNQPFLAEIDRFIIADVGAHLLDIARFLMGEVKNLRCLTQKINPNIKGEDVANVLMEMRSAAHCYIEMSYASILEKESFPETLILLEGSDGSIKLEHDFSLSITNREGTHKERVAPKIYDWVNPDYALVQSCMVDLNKNFLQALQENKPAEITGKDNYRTMQLVYASYDSAATGSVVSIEEPHFIGSANKKKRLFKL